MKKDKLPWCFIHLSELRAYYFYSLGPWLLLEHNMWYGEKLSPENLPKPSLTGFIKYVRQNIATSKNTYASYQIIHKGRNIYSHNDDKTKKG